MNHNYIFPLNSPGADLENVGGKGANLAILAKAGFQVPDGFTISTSAYRKFVKANELEGWVLGGVESVNQDDPAALEAASEEIRSRFAAGAIPLEIADEIKAAYAGLDNEPVAVRSSATTEDLPEMSFAGQQDTFLNVIGEEALLGAVVRCWSSLWTARAIAYRIRNQIDHAQAALAVIVQLMVQSEVSGVLFTANPLTGNRTEYVIDATYGLGEALVSGQVEPDHYVVEITKREVTNKTLGAKSTVIRGDAQGGVVTETVEGGDQQALNDAHILLLAEQGQRIAKLYQIPQDIEWAQAEGQIFILQSRAITSLYPLPEGMQPDPLRVFFSFASVQGIKGPMTPLGRDMVRQIFAGGGSIFGLHHTHETQPLLHEAGERLWGEMTMALRHPLGVNFFPRFFSVVDKVFVEILSGILDDPRLGAGKGRLRLSTFFRIARFLVPVYLKLPKYLIAPEGKARQLQQKIDGELIPLREFADSDSGLAHNVQLLKKIFHAFPVAFPGFGPGLFAGLFPMFLLSRISSHLTGSGDLALEITRGMPNNVTTEMDLHLWRAAQAIRSDPAAAEHVLNTDVEALAGEYLQGGLPADAQEAVVEFMAEYGMRGVNEIDFGRPRWREKPAPIMQALQSYLKIEDREQAPDAVFTRGEREAAQAVQKLQTAARATFGGGIKAHAIGALARRMRAYAGLRESPKFYVMRMMGIMRLKLLESGRDLVEAGVISAPDDLCYLTLNELSALADGGEQDWKALVADRREVEKREHLRRQEPRMILSDGCTYYHSLSAGEDEEGVITGSPVSPGLVEGVVRVVHDPHEADLAPGEILVCHGTDPAWTPLFLAAGGLVMEIGGVMTHGAIVSREYGIPAVVGIYQVTERLKTGQRIRLDGSSGRIQMLDD
ncbi:PEP/pyruvate-binding domain-containing protein [Chloroflexota bacterium]